MAFIFNDCATRNLQRFQLSIASLPCRLQAHQEKCGLMIMKRKACPRRLRVQPSLKLLGWLSETRWAACFSDVTPISLCINKSECRLEISSPRRADHDYNVICCIKSSQSCDLILTYSHKTWCRFWPRCIWLDQMWAFQSVQLQSMSGKLWSPTPQGRCQRYCLASWRT